MKQWVIAAGSANPDNARMRKRTASFVAFAGRAASALAMLLIAGCASYTTVDKPPAARLPQPVAKPEQPPMWSVPEVAVDSLPPAIGSRTASGTYRARSGETAYSVARRYGVDPYALITANDLVPPFELYEGQRLIIPDCTSRCVAPTTSAAGASAKSERQAPRASDPQSGGDRQIAALPRPTVPAETSREISFIWPVEGRVIGDFGPKGGGRYNDGINIAAPAGTRVRAAESGIVAYTGNELRGFGNMLLLKHANSWITFYAHNQELLVKRGEQVRRGQVIARVGSSGNVDQPQLHFQMRKGKRPIDPLRELPRPSAAAQRREAG